MDMPLPLKKLSFGDMAQATSLDIVAKNQVFVVLVSTGSFNPPTYMHLRMFELARDALVSEGYCVVGGYMSPVNDAYKKRDLLSADHRIQMCELATRSSSFVMVDTWEAKQCSFQRTLNVLKRVQSFLCESGLSPAESIKVMLLCGSDLLESFATPGIWIRDQPRNISGGSCQRVTIEVVANEIRVFDRPQEMSIENLICGWLVVVDSGHGWWWFMVVSGGGRAWSLVANNCCGDWL